MDRWDAADTTILQLRVDDEPAFRKRQVRWAWLTPLLMLVVCGSWLAIGLPPFDSSQQRVRTGDIARTVRSGLSHQLLGDVRVSRVRCVRRSESNARCVAELFDKGGDGPIIQRVTVSIDDDTGEYLWRPGPAH
jgi:hypothetical protein